MCEAHAFILKDGEEEKVLESVDHVELEGRTSMRTPVSTAHTITTIPAMTLRSFPVYNPYLGQYLMRNRKRPDSRDTL